MRWVRTILFTLGFIGMSFILRTADISMANWQWWAMLLIPFWFIAVSAACSGWEEGQRESA